VKNLIFDVFSGLLFMLVLLLTKDIYAALTVALLAAVAQLIWSKFHQQKISSIQ
jgi:intracellular septation protein A